jgi:hypothetical protein
MLKLRRFLCGCFGYIAAIYLFAAFFTIQSFFHPQAPYRSVPLTHDTTLPSPLISIILLALSKVIRVMPLVLGALYGMAWWTIKWGKVSGRGWAIAASLVMVLQSIPFFILPLLLWTRIPHGHMKGLLILGLLMLALGIAGLVAFAQRDTMAQPLSAAKPPRIAGDGTSRLLDGIAWIIGVAGYFAAMFYWRRWGVEQHLPRPYVGLLRLVIIILIITAVHELGHTVTGLAFGMKLRAFVVGPFQWRIRDGRWKFQFILAKSFSAGGATALVPTNSHQSLGSQICMIAAGPTMNLLTGLIALYAALTAKGQPYEQYWGFFAYFSTISLLVFASNLIPMQSEASYSDGGRIYQLLAGGPLADLYRVMNLVGATLVTPLRPRDYDIDAIQRAEISFKEGQQALLLRFFASYYFLDHGMISQACAAFIDAESIYGQSALELPAELHSDFVFSSAFLRRDAAGARRWWERMEAKKPTHFGVDYWLARSALYWIEGHKEEARTTWEKGNVLAQQLPEAGCYEFDRYRYSLLHDCIEKEEINAAS